MKKAIIFFAMAVIGVAYAGMGVSSDASVEHGKKLFNDSTLGGSANDKSCSTCHPDGRGLKGAGVKDNLTQMINMCITRPLKGQELDEQSTELESLRLYIKSLGK